MRLLRFSFFLSLISSKRNLKKALMFINIGIFLSCFAVSTSFISLYFENKINDQEFKLTTFQKDLHYSKITEEFLQRMINLMERDKNRTKQDLFIQQFLVDNSFFSKVISRKDIYELEESPEGYAFFTNENFEYFDDKLDKLIRFGPLTKHQLKDLKEILKKKESDFKIIKEKYSKITLEEGLSLYDKSYEDLLKEINLGYSQDQDPGNEVYDKFFFTYNFLKNITEYFEYFLIEVRIESSSFYLGIEEANQEIKKYSKYEKTSILIAFILQLIVFLIIQFFEIGAARRKI